MKRIHPCLTLLNECNKITFNFEVNNVSIKFVNMENLEVAPSRFAPVSTKKHHTVKNVILSVR